MSLPEPFIIAEIGSNWKKYDDTDKDFKVALQQIDAAKSAGADAVKFQLFTAMELYGTAVVGTQLAAKTDRYALPVDWLPLLKEYADKVGIEFMCTAFSPLGYGIVDPFVKRHKVASIEASHPEIQRILLNSEKQVLWSNGLSVVRRERLKLAYPKDILMDCVVAYPANYEDYVLRLVRSHWAASHPDGLSDHTKGEETARLYRRLGCVYFEKHVDFLLKTGSPGPDTKVSIDAEDFEKYILAVINEPLYEPQDLKMLERQPRDGGWYRRFSV